MNKDGLLEQVIKQMKKVHESTDLNAIDISEVLVDSSMLIMGDLLKQAMQEAEEHDFVKGELNDIVNREAKLLGKYLTERLEKSNANAMTITLSIFKILSNSLCSMNEILQDLDNECTCGNCDVPTKESTSSSMDDLISRLSKRGEEL